MKEIAAVSSCLALMLGGQFGRVDEDHFALDYNFHCPVASMNDLSAALPTKVLECLENIRILLIGRLCNRCCAL
ncbi:hypothetical protein AOLI_G00271920 [Acnodon oligacanthus]